MLQFRDMKIGIDTCGCDHARSGLGSFLRSFIAHLPMDDGFEFELFGVEEDRYIYRGDKEISFSSVSSLKSLKEERSWHKRKIQKFIAKNKYDAVIFPAPEKVIPLKFPVFSVAIINTPFSKNKDAKTRKHLKKGLKKINCIVVPSEFIRNDLIENGIDESKIRVIHNGIDHKVFFPSLDLDVEILDIKPFAIKRPYFIYCSRLSSEDKRHVELIKAFCNFKKKTGLPHRLVLAGSDGEYSEKVHNAAFEAEFAQDIFVTGYFPYESLTKLYGGADACVFPAENEGAGLPLLEAMACGVPVLSSSSGALKETGGDVPLYFDSTKIEEIAELMEKVVSDSELKKSMVEKGLKWAEKFNWETTVGNILKEIK